MRSVALLFVLCAVPHILFFLFEPASILVKIFLVLGIISLWSKAEDSPSVWGMAATVLLALCPAFYRWWSAGGLRGFSLDDTQALFTISTIALKVLVLPVFAAFIAAVLGVAIFLALNRMLLSWTARGSPFMLFLLLVVNALLTVLFLAPTFAPVFFIGRSSDLSDALAKYVQATDPETHPYALPLLAAMKFLAVIGILPALTGTLLVVVVILILVHRAIWPIFWRPLLALHNFQIVKQHKLLGTLGALCLWKAWPNPVTEFLHSTLLPPK